MSVGGESPRARASSGQALIALVYASSACGTEAHLAEQEVYVPAGLLRPLFLISSINVHCGWQVRLHLLIRVLLKQRVASLPVLLRTLTCSAS